ncbi:MAG: FAD-binding oxidoreductase [Amylibacter sp.]|nr:FAD-binding oxidoreductase [Amylibacter sp.]
MEDICGWVALAGNYTSHPTFKGAQTTDWAIIGGGFTGLAAARRIANLDPNARIILIEGKRVGQGATGRNSGFVVANESPGHAALSSASGRAGYAALNALDHAGVAATKRLVESHKINCQWEDTGSIHAATSSKNFGTLRHHAQAFADMGINATLLDEAALQKRLGTAHYKLGVLSTGGALVQPAMLAKGLADSLPEQVEIYENSPVLKLVQDGDGAVLTLKDGTLRANKVIVGVNAFMPRLGIQADRVFPLALTASLTRPLSKAEEDQIGHAASWGVLSPQSLGATMRLTKDRRILIRNTAEYRPSGIDLPTLAQRRGLHYQGLKKRFPWLAGDAIDYTWSGNICVSANSKPVFRKLSNNIFAAGCYNASGVARGTIMGRLIVDLAMDVPSTLLDTANSLPKPSWIPPRPLFDIAAKTRMAFERAKGKSEC